MFISILSDVNKSYQVQSHRHGTDLKYIAATL